MGETPQKTPLTLETALQDELRGLFKKCKSSVMMREGRLSDAGEDVIAAMASDFIKFLDSQGLESDLLRDFMVNFRVKVAPFVMGMFYEEFGNVGAEFYHELMLTFAGACIEAFGRDYEELSGVAIEVAPKESDDVAATQGGIADTAKAITDNASDGARKAESDQEDGGAGESPL